MRILILNWRDIKHPLSGGAEISLFEHAKYWKSKGAKVIWLASSFDGAKKEEEIEDIRIIRAGSSYTVHFLAFFYYILGRLGNPSIVVDCFHFLPFFTPIYIRKTRIVSLINEVAGKLWFSNIFLPLALVGFLAEPLFIFLYKKRQFITSSESTKSELLRLGIPLSNIHIVYHGVTKKKLEDRITKEKNPTIAFLGRISADKGIEDALNAFQDLRGKLSRLQFWIVGKEEKKGFLRQLVKKLNLSQFSSQIRYFDYVDENKKFELLRKAWILLHPSKKEGWGLTVIEAASQGTPTIGYRTEGLKDSILDGKTGFLVEPNHKDLSALTLKVILDSKLYNEVSIGALKWAARFDWKKSGRQSWKILNKYLAKP